MTDCLTRRINREAFREIIAANENLPAGRGFDMGTFAGHHASRGRPVCGTVACLLGNWYITYGRQLPVGMEPRELGISNDEYWWLFGATVVWEPVDGGR